MILNTGVGAVALGDRIMVENFYIASLRIIRQENNKLVLGTSWI